MLVVHPVGHRHAHPPYLVETSTRVVGFFPRAITFARSREFVNLLRIAFDRPLPVANVGPFRRAHLRALAWLNIACALAWATAYGILLVRAPGAALVAVVVPHLFAFLLSGLRPYLEHAGTGTGAFLDARTYSSPLMTV